ncbi:kinase-like protein [Hymenopellis radicata]|nr:kinase-like protein [Hymenopellis radicata]
MGSHSLLLRLFQSYFSVHVALQYLRLYSDNIGITYYITRRLRQLDTEELADVWGFICHLLVTRPSKSRALECFVVDICTRSTHIAMITLWFMQATLRDLSSTQHDSQSFMICQRILLRCHEIIFGDLPPPATGPYSSISLPFQSRFSRKKIKAHTQPVLVGIGLVLAGTPVLPRLTEIMGQVAIEQGRIDDDGTDQRSIDRHDHDSAPSNSPSISTTSVAAEEDDQDEVDLEEPDSPSPDQHSDNPRAKLSRRRTIGASQTAPTLPLHLRSLRKSRLSIDPLGQFDSEQIVSPYQSTPSVSTSRQPLRSASTNIADALLETYDIPAQSHLLRSHYCRSEVQFLLTLENISNRLLVIPRPARISALRAELTALNHKLPAEICMPMWCSSSDTPQPQGTTQPHHRVVRIPPGERRFEENCRKRKRAQGCFKGSDPIQQPPYTNHHHSKSDATSNGSDVVVVPGDAPPPPLVVDPPTPTLLVPPDEEEEIDLVEQLYGAEQSLRSRPVDISDSIVLPPTPKNKELDMAAWSRPSSIPPSPRLENGPSSYGPSSSRLPDPASPYPSQLHDVSSNGPALSLDEYSERMRTAAIMLAQLNANIAREPVSNSSASDSTSHWAPMSWLPGSNWLTISAPPPPPASSPLEHQQPARMRLQPHDASAIKERIMQEMLALEEERMERMKENREMESIMRIDNISGMKTAEDEGIIRRELNKADPSAVVFSESWAAKKSRIRHGSPYGHLVNWDCVSVIVKTGGDLRQEQLATQLIREFQRIWTEENCQCWARYFRIVILGGSSGLVETITDAVSIHSIKKAEYARRLTEGRLGHVTLFDHFQSTYGDPSSAKFARAQRNFAKSLAAAPFKLPIEYIEVLGGVTGPAYLEFRRLFKEGFEAARKHCDRIITLIELMQKDSTFPCFTAFGDQTANLVRERFQPALTHSLIGEHVDRLIDTSLGSHWTRLYDSFQYYSQSIL